MDSQPNIKPTASPTKPNRLQRRKPTDLKNFKKKKKHQNPNTEQFTQSEASNQKSVHHKSLKLKQA